MPSTQMQTIASGPQILDVQGGKIRVVPVATGLFHPWSLAFPDARTILVTERNGRLRMIRDGVLAVRDGRLKVSPQKNGPLGVSGNLEILSGTGRTIMKTMATRLCRCGHSGCGDCGVTPGDGLSRWPMRSCS